MIGITRLTIAVGIPWFIIVRHCSPATDHLYYYSTQCTARRCTVSSSIIDNLLSACFTVSFSTVTTKLLYTTCTWGCLHYAFITIWLLIAQCIKHFSGPCSPETPRECMGLMACISVRVGHDRCARNYGMT